MTDTVEKTKKKKVKFDDRTAGRRNCPVLVCLLNTPREQNACVKKIGLDVSIVRTHGPWSGPGQNVWRPRPGTVISLTAAAAAAADGRAAFSRGRRLGRTALSAEKGVALTTIFGRFRGDGGDTILCYAGPTTRKRAVHAFYKKTIKKSYGSS